MGYRDIPFEDPPCPEGIAAAWASLAPEVRQAIPAGYIFGDGAGLVRLDPNLPDPCEMTNSRGEVFKVPAPLAPWIAEELAKAG